MEKRGHQIKMILIEKMLGILYIKWEMTVIVNLIGQKTKKVIH